MNLEQIKSLVSVVNNKSFSLAAKEMYVSQPTISMHIKTLEREIGEQLLIRSTKDVILSEAGLTFYPYAVQMLKAEEEALFQISNKEKKLSGEVTIVSSSVPTNYLLPGFAAYSKQKCNGINYRISEEDSTGVIQKILHFEQEIGIGSICPKNIKCMYWPLVKDKIILITPNTQKYRAYNGVFHLEDLKKEDFVMRENGSGTKAAGDSLEKKLGLEPHRGRVIAEVQTTETLKQFVAEGVGVAFASNIAVKDYADQEKVLMFEFPNVEAQRQLYLIQHVDRNLSKVGERAVKLLKEYSYSISDENGFFKI